MARVEYRQSFHRYTHTDGALLASAPQSSSKRDLPEPVAGEIHLSRSRPTDQRTSLLDTIVGGLKRFFELNTSVSESEIANCAYQITSVFESGGNIGALQTYDSGIISFGRHQATLASGTLEKVIERFCATSNTVLANELRGYSTRISERDSTLRNDKHFLKLLTRAATEEPQTMQAAQDHTFGEAFYQPAAKLSQKCGLSSPLAKALFFDTKVQGGCERVICRTAAILAKQLQSSVEYPELNKLQLDQTEGASAFLKQLLQKRIVTEKGILKTFLHERKEYLLAVAKRKERSGDLNSARALRNSASYRIHAYEALLASGNLNLTGDFTVRRTVISGL